MNVVRHNDLRQNSEYHRIVENYAWYSGELALINFFNQWLDAQEDLYGLKRRYFWGTAHGMEERIYHDSLPETISEAMANLIFGLGYTINTDDRIKDIDEDRDLNSLLRAGAIAESWGGRCAYKINFIEGQKTPEIVLVPAYNYRIHGSEIEFFTEYKKGNKVYRILEHYGYGYIHKEVIELVDDMWVSRPFDQIPETAGMKEVIDIPENVRLAIEKHNINYISDYEGSQQLFDKLDMLETLSSIASEQLLPITYGPRIISN